MRTNIDIDDELMTEAMELLGGTTKKQTVEQAFVKIGRRSRNQVEIIEGLSPGDVVVTAGQNRLSGGVPVKIDNTVNPATANPTPMD